MDDMLHRRTAPRRHRGVRRAGIGIRCCIRITRGGAERARWVPLAVIAGRDRAMAAMVDTWIELKRKDGTIDALIAHWILSQDPASKRPRWSVIDNVLRRPR
jgi:hypothetical protein